MRARLTLAAAGCLLAAGALGADFDSGMRAFRSADYGAAFDAWSECAHAGTARCQYALGVLLDEGRGVAPDARAARMWYERAARQDFPDALLQLGFLYATGRDGITQDPIQSWVWFARAAALGIEDAQRYRDRVFDLLTEDERAEAQRRADELSIRHHLQE